jgi:hypothetical protein
MVFASSVSGKVIIATNGLLLAGKMSGFMAAEVVSVSIHNSLSWQGLTAILAARKLFKPRIHVCATMVDGEKTGVLAKQLKIADEVRIYEPHTRNGKWGSIGLGYLPKKEQAWCSRLDTDLVIAWDGSVSRCCYVWDPIPGLSAINMSLKDILESPQIKSIREKYPDKICRECSQWQGMGKTL